MSSPAVPESRGVDAPATVAPPGVERASLSSPLRLSAAHAARSPACAHCGAAIGVYELMRWIRPDGVMTLTGWLRVRADPLHTHPASRFLHVGCFVPDV